MLFLKYSWYFQLMIQQCSEKWWYIFSFFLKWILNQFNDLFMLQFLYCNAKKKKT